MNLNFLTGFNELQENDSGQLILTDGFFKGKAGDPIVAIEHIKVDTLVNTSSAGDSGHRFVLRLNSQYAHMSGVTLNTVTAYECMRIFLAG